MPASAFQRARKVERKERLAYLVSEQFLTLREAAERLGVCPNSCCMMMKELELKVFGFNEQVRKRRGQSS